jgi:hypothetical protein
MIRALSSAALLSTAIILGAPISVSAVPVAPDAGWLFDDTYGVIDSTITDNFGSIDGLTKGTGTGPTNSADTRFSYSGNSSFSTIGGPTNGDATTTWHGAFLAGSFRDLVSGAAAVTMQVWVKYESSAMHDNAYGNVVLNGAITGGTAGLWINIRDNNSVVIGGRSQAGDGFQELASAPGLVPGQWNHIVGVLDFANDQILVSINGGVFESGSASFGANTFVPGPSLTTPDLIPARTSSSGARYIGLIDEVAIWSTALSQDDVQWLSQNSLHSIPEPTTMYMAMTGLGVLLSVRTVYRKR